MAPLSDLLRTWRRRVKAALPYVRRREYRSLQRRHAELIDALDGVASPAAQARLHVVKSLATDDLAGDVCLFVSHAAQPDIKPHVVNHVRDLVTAGIRVVLILNTDLEPASLLIDTETVHRASGVLVRQNLGLDFGAWAHALALCGTTAHWTRLFLVNDSIVGPLNAPDFAQLIERVRRSSADVVGLTEALAPARHLQSYFLVFGPRALRHPAVQNLFSRVLNWPAKSQVIEVYEARLTAQLTAHGLHCEALFPSLSGDPLSSDDTSLRWAELIQQGFPYVKTRVLDQLAPTQRDRLLAGLAPDA
jgi:hypothetical protein